MADNFSERVAKFVNLKTLDVDRKKELVKSQQARMHFFHPDVVS